MKTLWKRIYQITAIISLTFSSTSFAGGTSGEQIIKKIKVNQSGIVSMWGTTGGWNNPDSCDNSTYIVLTPTINGQPNEYYSEMYALAVASYLQGKTISGFLGQCETINNVTYPKLLNIQSF